ncbi:MAG TPA: ImmA/IrrE family metallo-endopeptidase [Terriglobales bacterium]|jgi:hypothetical protein|nr:ImmA/IrrE family metallo-endopeptidase [Terriglobales bacterium]
MPLNKPYCKELLSPLVRLFIQRSGLDATAGGEEIISALVEGVRRRYARKRCANHLQLFLNERHIHHVEVAPQLSCDGFIEPLGITFADGFRMLLKKNSAESRMRFTMAHEVCHTFFYELVPELKFAAHSPDQQEERLCNFGAAALLMPPVMLRRSARDLPVCLESLQRLAEDFSVSLPSMAIRLKSLRLWNCQLSLWRRMVNGTFALDGFYGGKRVAWEWQDDTILQTAWESDEPLTGRTFVSYQDYRAVRRYRPIAFQIRRYGEGVMALWGNAIKPTRSSPTLPLFEKPNPVPLAVC